jgi:hypothetical protein
MLHVHELTFVNHWPLGVGPPEFESGPPVKVYVAGSPESARAEGKRTANARAAKRTYISRGT